MTSITQFGRPETRAISEEALEALQGVASKFGLMVKYNGGSFTHNNAILKFEFAVQNAGQMMSREAETFKLCAKRYGMEPSDLGTSFVYKGGVYTVSGLNPKAPKMPILATLSMGNHSNSGPI